MYAPMPAPLDHILLRDGTTDAAVDATAETGLDGARHSFDAFDSATSVVRAAFRSVQLDASEPHVVEFRFARVDDVNAVLPGDAAVVRSVLDADGDLALLARGSDYSVFVQQDDRCFAMVSASTPDRARAVAEAIRALVPAREPDDRRVAIEAWHRSGNGPRSVDQTIDVPRWDDIGRNYPPATRAALDRLLAMRRPAGSGRLLIWHGPPGTGKTTALRALFRAWTDWCHVAYIADPEAMFTQPDYLYRVVGEACDCGRARLVVAEDGDDFLRAGARFDAGAALGRLLNLTDGVLGQGSDTYVLLTTNTALDRLHPALVRPGRCLAAVEFRAFEPAEAAEWLGEAHPAPPNAQTLADLFVLRGDVEQVAAPNAAARQTGTGLYL